MRVVAGTTRSIGAAALVTLSIVFSTTSIAVAGSNGSVDQPLDGGSVIITQPGSPARQLGSGDSNSSFSLVLPEGASCPGDSFNGDWRVQSFIVPATDDPGALRYGIISPDGDGRRSLAFATTIPFVHNMTGRSNGPGEPGPIQQPEPLTMSVYEAGLFPAGTYRIGLACTRYRETALFWDTEIVISDDPDVQPGGFTWRVADASFGADTDLGGTNSSGAWMAALAGIAVVAGIVVIGQRRRSSRNT